LKKTRDISILKYKVSKFIKQTTSESKVIQFEDSIIKEEPLEIKVEFGEKYRRKIESIALTMRTIGNDADLARGFLFSEAIINSNKDILSIEKNAADENQLTVRLHERVQFDLGKLSRHLFTSSSCGVCGKEKISNLFISKNKAPLDAQTKIKISAQQILKIFGSLQEHQTLFLISGRISFELVQKAVLAGCGMVLALGAPSSLAIKVANENNLCLIGFLKNDGFNIYSSSSSLLH